MSRKNIALDFANFYTKEKEKRIPNEILNESLGTRKWFFIGFYAADGHREVNLKEISVIQKHRITNFSSLFLSQSLGLKTCIGITNDKINVFLSNNKKKLSDEKIHKIINLRKQNDYVYDKKTETHDFVCRFPLKVHNTDRFV